MPPKWHGQAAPVDLKIRIFIRARLKPDQSAPQGTPEAPQIFGLVPASQEQKVESELSTYADPAPVPRVYPACARNPQAPRLSLLR